MVSTGNDTNGVQMLPCLSCEKEKPSTDFDQYHGGAFYKNCKECVRSGVYRRGRYANRDYKKNGSVGKTMYQPDTIAMRVPREEPVAVGPINGDLQQFADAMDSAIERNEAIDDNDRIATLTKLVDEMPPVADDLKKSLGLEAEMIGPQTRPDDGFLIIRQVGGAQIECYIPPLMRKRYARELQGVLKTLYFYLDTVILPGE